MLTNTIVTGLIILRDCSSGSAIYYCFCALPFASFVPHFALCNAQQPAQQTCFELTAGKAEAKVVATAVGVPAVTIRNARVPRNVVPTAATRHAVRAG